ncbi:flagellar basal-body rod modification protein FlgD [Thalassobacillus cyri]|uniref:Flagellar basal-body rod modification protein FlgD n=1 Tax=Thalassobacillus cyri TaxID=571932 RepID=A0A1H4G2K5_9BACI|nr:flagellar hook assembly protein FlgD [Thalassobacillus cyri]SEB03270.1 flagellar basal-body rod modification protein FlgD [Thalassobacillus cyri]
MTKVDASLYLNQQPSRGSTNSTLDKDDFMKILMTQLQTQDPMNPMEDKEFISQMASFSSLEQMMNMSKAMEKMTESQSFAPVVQYSSLIGKEVTYPIDEAENGDGSRQENAVVTAVSQKNGEVLLELKNGKTVDVQSISRVSDLTTE